MKNSLGFPCDLGLGLKEAEVPSSVVVLLPDGFDLNTVLFLFLSMNMYAKKVAKGLAC
jgi:hypothetical protein